MMLKFSSPRRFTASAPRGSGRKRSICRMLATVGMISPFSRNSGPSTPATSNWFFASPVPWPTPFNVIALPTMFGSAPKARVQKP